MRGAAGAAQQPKDGESNVVVVAALFANLGIAIAKFAGAAITGSSAMLTEAFHSVVDTLNEVLLLYGKHRAKKPADAVHPLGYGRELYFWSFVVAILIFAVGAGFSIYEGVKHLIAPEPIESPAVNFAILGVALLMEGTSWAIAFRSFNKERGDIGLFRAIHLSKDPTTFIVLLEDSAALMGLVAAGIGVALSVWTGNPIYDGGASILIGLILGVVAVVLARESKHLLIGERAEPALARAITMHIEARPEVASVNDVMTIHLSPDQIVAAASVDFVNERSAGEVERAIREVQELIHREWPAVTRIYVTPREADEDASPR